MWVEGVSVTTGDGAGVGWVEGWREGEVGRFKGMSRGNAQVGEVEEKKNGKGRELGAE